ncbi:MAG: glutamate--tRNA ligase [Roseovarius sp.]|nr:glutamate--tRNA ligase [Roseovarius sp.]
MTQKIVTRFAPSPTGYLHIGGARTALFNWLYARKNGGSFLLRIEDTDRVRSTPEAKRAILDGMDWLGLDYDGKPTMQFERSPRHAEIAQHLLNSGKAYKCFSSQEEIVSYRESQKAKNLSTLFQSPWRDATPDAYPEKPHVIRIKAPREGQTTISDIVQGEVRISNDQLDDMILLRSDGSPVYMLAVAVDDHDMGVTHVIRGDDHLANAARQMMIYNAMEWPLPTYAHIPLIHGTDGKKMSKRHGALGVGEYRDMGYPAAGLRNYLARLGWSHGDEEFFSDKQALEWFDLRGIGKSPARFDFRKLAKICGGHMAVADDAALQKDVERFLDLSGMKKLSDEKKMKLRNAMPFLKTRSKTLVELIEHARFILSNRPLEMDEKAVSVLNVEAFGSLRELTLQLQSVKWSRVELEETAKRFAESKGMKFGALAGPLRASLAGCTVTPSVFDMMIVLGREETIARIQDAVFGNIQT